MLVIGRRRGEALRIGEDITIVVREIRGKHVKLTISAPPSVAIARAELDVKQTGHVSTDERRQTRSVKVGGEADGDQS